MLTNYWGTVSDTLRPKVRQILKKCENFKEDFFFMKLDIQDILHANIMPIS